MTIAKSPAFLVPACPAPFAARFWSVAVAVVLSLATPAIAMEWACPETGLGDQACGRATCGDSDLTVGDALLALQTAVGTATCTACRCDTDSSGAVRASDAGRILAASVGQPVALDCPVCNALTIDASAQETEIGAVVDEVAATGDGGVVATWVADASVIARRFDAMLAPTGEAQALASSADAMIYLRACGRADGSTAVAWESEALRTLPVPHDYDDTGNAMVALSSGAGDTTGEVGLHNAATGEQTPLGLFCLPSGEVTAIWRSRCIGTREVSEGAFTSYFPQSCPVNGVHLRRFDSGGSPLADSRVVVRSYSEWYLPWERAIAMPDGRFAVSSTNRLVVSDGHGNVEVDKTIAGASNRTFRHDCSAGSDRCVAVNDTYSLLAVVHDVDTTDDGIAVVLRASESGYEPPYDITIRASLRSFACDSQGICVAAWTLYREEWDWDNDYENTTILGMFARAFNVHTGELGPEIPLAPQRIVNAGPGRFVSVEAGEGVTLLRSLVVH